MIALVDRVVERLALRFALEAAHPHIDRLVGLALIAPGDDHAVGDLERNDLLFHDLQPLRHLAGPHVVLPQFIKSHRSSPVWGSRSTIMEGRGLAKSLDASRHRSTCIGWES